MTALLQHQRLLRVDNTASTHAKAVTQIGAVFTDRYEALSGPARQAQGNDCLLLHQSLPLVS